MSHQNDGTTGDENGPPTSQPAEQQPGTHQGGQSVGISGVQSQGRSIDASAPSPFPPGRLVPFTSRTLPSQTPMGLYMPCASPNGNLAILSLSQCAAQGHLPLVRLALDGGASPNFANRQRKTALHLAAQGGHVEVVELLLERGADITKEDVQERTALHTAAENGCVDVVRLLLQRGADVNLRGLHKKTALHLAAEKGHERVVAALIQAGADMELRMKEMAGIPCPGARALHCAILGGDSATVNTLLDSGADVDGEDRWDRMTPLCLATKSGNFDIVQLLLERRANPNGARGAEHSPLVCACSRGHNKIVQLLLDRLADIELKDADGDPALHSAACFGHLSTVELLLKSDADVNARGAGHRTALWYATEGEHEAVVGLLLKHGADGDPKSDMKDDSHIPLGKVADGDVFRHIERGQQLMFHESDFTSWSEKLFFVVNSDTNGSSGSDLTLIQPDTESKEPYIAVSYCWSGHQDSSTATPLRIHIPQKDEPGCPPHTRDVRANSSVIRRCMEFAAAKGVKRIWIDQESIDQENNAVKQQAIQSMHLVYRRAAHTLVLLDCHVQSPDDIQALSEILRHGVHDDFRDRILGDRWFTRAWTFQEWINSQLENLSYLVGWKDDVDVDGIAWRRVADARNRDGKVQKVSRAWEFGHDEIFSMSFRSMRHTEVMRSLSASATFGGIGSEKRSFTLLDTSAEEMEGKTDVPLCQSKSYQKLRMTMPAAYGTLSGKRNLLVSDRLAILSNLTHYRYRIHTHEVIQNALSFTASVIATALYNGDLTILFCRPGPVRADGDEVPEKQRNPSWAPLGEYGLSYLKLPYALSEHSRLSDRIRSGDPCLVLDGKALVRGILWDIVPFHGFDQLADAVGCFLREYTKPYRTKEGKIDEAGHVVFQLLVEQLLSQDRTDIVELLLISALPRQLASPAEAFKLIGELKEWRRTRAEEDWPNHILEKSSLETDHLGVARFAGTAGGLAMIMTERSLFPPYEKVKFLGGHPWGNQIIQWIYRAISKGMPLALGQCEIGGETLVSLFMLDPAKHSVVFTPLSELEYEYGANVAIHMHLKENFWVVKGSGGKVGDGLIQRAKDKLRTFEMHEENISSDIFEIQNAGHVCGVWSPRLSRAGIWTKSDGKTWEMRPLGKAPSYIWFD